NPIQIGNVISFWADLPQSTSAMQFGHVSKVPSSDKRSRTFKAQRDYTGVQVTYFDFDTRAFEEYQEC
ncbi:hypothetical protein NL496_28315, partial [Klebsiella pneumoniae]|nr:hypothetical protein [Klebsiella pneumoniae]